MYHRIVDPIPAGDDYARTPAQFRADLARLDRAGYTSIAMRDLVAGRIDVPAGRTPVVLTFDDSSESQFRQLPDGSVDPDSAVGILNAFAESHPEFGRHAIFYANANLFDQKGLAKHKLDELIAWGYEIGNHTYSHANLSQLDAAGAQAQIGRMAALLKELEPDYTVTGFALPFGAMPHAETLALRGSYRGVPYRYTSDVLVGAEPAPSPFAKRFDPLRSRASGRPGPRATSSRSATGSSASRRRHPVHQRRRPGHGDRDRRPARPDQAPRGPDRAELHAVTTRGRAERPLRPAPARRGGRGGRCAATWPAGAAGAGGRARQAGAGDWIAIAAVAIAVGCGIGYLARSASGLQLDTVGPGAGRPRAPGRRRRADRAGARRAPHRHARDARLTLNGRPSGADGHVRAGPHLAADAAPRATTTSPSPSTSPACRGRRVALALRRRRHPADDQVDDATAVAALQAGADQRPPRRARHPDRRRQRP